MDGRRWVWLGCTMSLLVGCSGEEAPGSGIMMAEGGAGGSAGSAGSLSIDLPMPMGGGGATGGGATGTGASASGGGPAVMLHTCPASPDPACPAKVLADSVTVSSAEQVAALQGVTHIMGDLEIETPLGLDALSCLETVDGEVVVDLFGESDEGTLWGLRNLQTVGATIDISAGSANLYADCGLSRLASTGADYLTGGAVDVSGRLSGELDLSQLKVGKHMRIKGSQLTKVTLPSNTTIVQGQLAFDSNSKLSEVLGFTGITFTPDNVTVGGAYSVLIRNNPLLSECRARELAQFYLDAGDSPDTVTVMGNLPCP